MEKDIGKIKKNENTEIVVRIDDFGGKPGLTIREYVTGDRYTGFTKSGTRISAENFREFKNLINSIDESEFIAESMSYTDKKASKPKKEQKNLVEEKKNNSGEEEDNNF